MSKIPLLSRSIDATTGSQPPYDCVCTLHSASVLAVIDTGSPSTICDYCLATGFCPDCSSQDAPESRRCIPVNFILHFTPLLRLLGHAPCWAEINLSGADSGAFLCCTSGHKHAARNYNNKQLELSRGHVPVSKKPLFDEAAGANTRYYSIWALSVLCTMMAYTRGATLLIGGRVKGDLSSCVSTVYTFAYGVVQWVGRQ